MTKPEVIAYLNRIGYNGPIDNSVSTLFLLQECHIHTVPYENIDILNGVRLSLDIPNLYDKIVVRRRGGYCFELNALFGWLLQELGFKVTRYFARFWRDSDEMPPKRRHQVLQVEAEGQLYLCDVGVGGIVPRQPILMKEQIEQVQGDESYKLIRDDYYGWVLCEQKRGEWRWIFSFTEEPQLPKDYMMASFWCEQAPESIFRKFTIAAIRTCEGRKSLDGRELKVFSQDGVAEVSLQTEAEVHEALRTHFGIVI